MSIWGGSVKLGKPCIFDSEVGSLDLTHATLISGGAANLIVKVSGGRRFVIGRLISDRPNLKIQLLFEEDAEFIVESNSLETEVSIIGNLRMHSANDSEADEDLDSNSTEEDEINCMDEYIAKTLRSLDCQFNEKNEDEMTNVSSKIVELNEEQFDKFQQEEQKQAQKRKEEEMKKNETKLISLAVPGIVEKKAALGSQVEIENFKKRKHVRSHQSMENKTKKIKISSEASTVNKTNEEQQQTKVKSTDEQKHPKQNEEKMKVVLERSKKETSNSSVTPGVFRELPGGIKYEILSVGSGRIASIGKRIKVKYEGRLAQSGKKFDHGMLDFIVGGGDMIKGFDIGTRGMLISEKRRVFVPARLAYGKQKLPDIPPNSDLIFEITLVSTS